MFQFPDTLSYLYAPFEDAWVVTEETGDVIEYAAIIFHADEAILLTPDGEASEEQLEDVRDAMGHAPVCWEVST